MPAPRKILALIYTHVSDASADSDQDGYNNVDKFI